MAIDKRVAEAADALADVRDGAVVMISGFGGAGFPNILLRALREVGPRDLTLVVNSATHTYSASGELIEAGLVRKVICAAARGHSKGQSPFEELWSAGKIELRMMPQGSFVESIRAAGAGIPAYYTPTGVGTELTEGQEVRNFHGRDHVLEHAIAGDLALVRADQADRYGNLCFRYAQMNFGPAMATACALAVAEVREATESPMPHDRIQLPGVYIDRVVAVGART